MFLATTMRPIRWVFLCLLSGLAYGRSLLRQKGIGTITVTTSAPGSGSGFDNVAIPNPSGASPPTPTTTPSPFSTYSASWDTTYKFNFANPTFNVDTSVVAAYTVQNMGQNFAVINTAMPVYPAPMPSSR